MKGRFFDVKIEAAMKRLFALIGLIFGLTAGAAAQDAASVLLPRINQLRASKGLPAYAPHASLDAAAANHARWMAATGAISHIQADGSGPRARAVQAGFPSNWVSENIYRGASAVSAWEWWLGSPVHYAGLVSPNYDRIGIGSASGTKGNAYVLVFGNSTGRLAGASGGDSAGVSGAAGAPSYVLGRDEVGNIRHEIQPGHDLGTIALIYGYIWDDIPYMLEINQMTWEDSRLLQPGEVFLVPPKAGTFTPAPVEDDATPAASTATAMPSATPSASARGPLATAPPSPAPKPALRIGALPSPAPAGASMAAETGGSLSRILLLGAAILLQLGALAIGIAALWWRSR